MTEQLYRVDESKYDRYGKQFNPVDRMKTLGVLVPVEPCEHGNVYPHHISYTQSEEGDEWWDGKTCEGAGLDSE